MTGHRIDGDGKREMTAWAVSNSSNLGVRQENTKRGRGAVEVGWKCTYWIIETAQQRISLEYIRL